MDLTLSADTLVVFDLDDTLYKEAEFLASAFGEISMLFINHDTTEVFSKMMQWQEEKADVFDLLLQQYPLPGYDKQRLLSVYRNHYPSIMLNPGAGTLLQMLREKNILMALVTDGRSTTQRNKIKALGIEEFFCRILISGETGGEKVTGLPFLLLEEDFPSMKKITIGDNINKDFEWPQKLGWITIGLADSGSNIHRQTITTGSCPPHYYINSFAELNIIHE